MPYHRCKCEQIYSSRYPDDIEEDSEEISESSKKQPKKQPKRQPKKQPKRQPKRQPKKQSEEEGELQSIMFDKSFFHTPEEVMEWAKTHGIKLKKEIHETKNLFRIRQLDPDRTAEYKTFNSDEKGVRYVYMFR
jgi:hypothetical protein